MAPKMKITYATMSADNEELQQALDAAVAKVKGELLGVEVPMFIAGEKVYAAEKTVTYSPVDTSVHLVTAQKGTRADAQKALAAAKAAAARVGRHALAGARRRHPPHRRADQRQQLRAVRHHGHGGRQEPAGGPG